MVKVSVNSSNVGKEAIHVFDFYNNYDEKMLKKVVVVVVVVVA